MTITTFGDHVTDHEEVTRRIAEIAAPFQPRWPRRRSTMFELDFWDDSKTADAVVAAASVAAVSGNVWAFTNNPATRSGQWLLNPTGGFVEALFNMYEFVSRIDHGTLGVDVAVNEIRVVGVPHNTHGATNAARNKILSELTCTVYRSTITGSDGLASSRCLTAAQQCYSYPDVTERASDLLAYGENITQLCTYLDALGWDDLYANAVELAGPAADDWVTEVTRRIRTHRPANYPMAPGLFARERAERLTAGFFRLLETRKVAAEFGVSPSVVDEIIDDAVPTDAIRALIATSLT